LKPALFRLGWNLNHQTGALKTNPESHVKFPQAGLRQLLLGGAAALVTFGIGHLIGASVA